MASSEVPMDERGHRATTKVFLAVVNGVCRTTENLLRGVLALASAGKRQTLPDIKNPMLLVPASTLAEKIRTGEWKSEDVVKAYIQRIIEVNPMINAVVDKSFEGALEEARKADLLVQSGVHTPEQLAAEKPFLGVPFSSKEAVLVKGLSSTCGLVCRKGMTANEDSDVVARLRNAGAIPMVVTNTSEVCMHWETYNNLYGVTNNPYDTTRNVGGSSGGEAALLAAAGSVMGLGTDLGGSIRIPAFFCGVFGHKPSLGVIPTGGLYPPVKEQIGRYAVAGPMVRYASDLRPILRVLTGNEGSTRLKLDEKVNFKSIKVYYMMNDAGNLISTPVSSEVRESFKNVIFWLKDSGIRTEAVRIDNLKYGMLIWCRCLIEVTEQRIPSLLSGDVKSDKEVLPPNKEMLKWLSGKSEYTFPLIFNACAQEYLAPLIMELMTPFNRRCEELKKQMTELLGDDGVFLYPTYPFTATYHNELLLNAMNLNYACIFNSLGFPVTQCSLGIGSTGMPVGLQAISAPTNDRLTIRFAEEVEKQFGGWVNPSQT